MMSELFWISLWGNTLPSILLYTKSLRFPDAVQQWTLRDKECALVVVWNWLFLVQVDSFTLLSQSRQLHSIFLLLNNPMCFIDYGAWLIEFLRHSARCGIIILKLWVKHWRYHFFVCQHHRWLVLPTRANYLKLASIINSVVFNLSGKLPPSSHFFLCISSYLWTGVASLVYYLVLSWLKYAILAHLCIKVSTLGHRALNAIPIVFNRLNLVPIPQVFDGGQFGEEKLARLQLAKILRSITPIVQMRHIRQRLRVKVVVNRTIRRFCRT